MWVVYKWICNKESIGICTENGVAWCFFNFYGKLCEICNYEMAPETEAKLLALIDEIHNEILSPKKEANDLLQPQDSGP